jgi:hypothetical protein
MAADSLNTPEAGKRQTNPLGIILALSALGLLLVLLFFQSSPQTEVPADQRAMAKALVDNMMTNGVLVNYDCSKTSAWVNRAVWDKSNSQQKRNMVLALATACDTQRAGYRISILDYDTKKEIAGFDGKAVRVE